MLSQSRLPRRLIIVDSSDNHFEVQEIVARFSRICCNFLERRCYYCKLPRTSALFPSKRFNGLEEYLSMRKTIWFEKDAFVHRPVARTGLCRGTIVQPLQGKAL
jgi:hypothetical protein